MTIQIFKGVQNQELVLKADYEKAASFEISLDAALHRERALERQLLSKEADYEKLAAECAALKKHIEIAVELWDAGAELDDHLIAQVETPAADAAIAEFKAQGVDEFAAVKIAIGEEEEEPSIIYAGKQAKLFAGKLRSGVEA